MSLTPGTRLGPYEIAAPLGAGGMVRPAEVEANDLAIWVNDDRSLPFWRSGRVLALDLASGQEHDVLAPPTSGSGRVPIYTFALSRDERSLFLVKSRNQADIWQVTLP